MKKTWSEKSRDTVPLMLTCHVTSFWPIGSHLVRSGSQWSVLGAPCGLLQPFASALLLPECSMSKGVSPCKFSTLVWGAGLRRKPLSRDWLFNSVPDFWTNVAKSEQQNSLADLCRFPNDVAKQCSINFLKFQLFAYLTKDILQGRHIFILNQVLCWAMFRLL